MRRPIIPALLLTFMASAAYAGLRQAAVPRLPPLVVSGGEVVLQLDIEPDGAVGGVQIFESAPPYDEALADAAQKWRFDAGGPRRALVAGVFTLAFGPAGGLVQADDVGPADLPFPIARQWPSYPARALGNAVVVIEASVGVRGRVEAARVVVSAPGFDAVALDAARAWRFRPASGGQAAVPSTVVLVFGFREPVSTPSRRR
jgi:TonB family protein